MDELEQQRKAARIELTQNPDGTARIQTRGHEYSSLPEYLCEDGGWRTLVEINRIRYDLGLGTAQEFLEDRMRWHG